ncbi:MAG: hypothetical protein M1812_005548 [Candelaria pacifica]|nr:MAG: hypothetical protein M1812_005548 [Candelaria pacifica]
MLSYRIFTRVVTLIAVLSQAAVTVITASPAGGSTAGLSDQISAELVAQDIQCHQNYGTNMDTIASDCAQALTFLDNYSQEYGVQRFEFGDEGVVRRFPVLQTWNTPVTQPFIQGECKIEVRMLPGASHLPTDVATFKDLTANATKIMICLMQGLGGRSIAGENKDIGVYVYRPTSKFSKYLQTVGTTVPSASSKNKLDLGGGNYLFVSEVDMGSSMCISGAPPSDVGKRRSGLLFGIGLVETLFLGFCEAGS